MDPGSTPTLAAHGEGTITREIARTETLVRLFQIDSTIELLEEIDQGWLGPVDRHARESVSRTSELLKYWRAQRAGLAKQLNLPALLNHEQPQERTMAMLPNDFHPSGRCSCFECLRKFPPA